MSPPGRATPALSVTAALPARLLRAWVLRLSVPLVLEAVSRPAVLSTLAAVRRETNSWRYPLIMAGYLFAMAYAASWITYHVALRFTGAAVHG